MPLRPQYPNSASLAHHRYPRPPLTISPTCVAGKRKFAVLRSDMASAPAEDSSEARYSQPLRLLASGLRQGDLRKDVPPTASGTEAASMLELGLESEYIMILTGAIGKSAEPLN